VRAGGRYPFGATVTGTWDQCAQAARHAVDSYEASMHKRCSSTRSTTRRCYGCVPCFDRRHVEDARRLLDTESRDQPIEFVTGVIDHMIELLERPPEADSDMPAPTYRYEQAGPDGEQTEQGLTWAQVKALGLEVAEKHKRTADRLCEKFGSWAVRCGACQPCKNKVIAEHNWARMLNLTEDNLSEGLATAWQSWRWGEVEIHITRQPDAATATDTPAVSTPIHLDHVKETIAMPETVVMSDKNLPQIAITTYVDACLLCYRKGEQVPAVVTRSFGYEGEGGELPLCAEHDETIGEFFGDLLSVSRGEFDDEDDEDEHGEDEHGEDEHDEGDEDPKGNGDRRPPTFPLPGDNDDDGGDEDGEDGEDPGEPSPGEVRTWWKTQGVIAGRPYKSKGPIPDAIWEAYHAAH
jgi:hypothetical protein